MGWGTILGLVWTAVSRGFSGRGLADTADRIVDRLAALQDAKSEVEKAEIEREIVQLKAIQDLQKPSSSWFFSPMMIGQYLIVVPFGLWWASVFIVSVAKPLLEGRMTVDDVPAHIFDMAWWLIPTIVAGAILGHRK